MSDVRQYYAFGHRIGSEIPLPLPERRDGTGTSLDIRLADIESGKRAGPGFEYDGAGRLRIPDDSTVLVDPEEGIDTRVRRLLLANGMALVLCRRGRHVLHAGAAVVDGRGVAFVGTGGVGKSSLTAELYARGHRVLTDDILLVERADDAVRAVSSFPRLTLDRRTFERLEPGADPVGAAGADAEKRWYNIGDQFEHGAVPLETVYLLEERSGTASPAVTSPSAEETMQRFLEHSVHLESEEGLERHFRDCSALAERTRVAVLHRPDGLETVPDVAATIEDDVGGGRNED